MTSHPSLPRLSWFLHWKSHVLGNPSAPGKLGGLVNLADHQFRLGIGTNVCAVFCFVFLQQEEQPLTATIFTPRSNEI